jgi:hypothetical protein
MEERWILQDMARERKRQSMRKNRIDYSDASSKQLLNTLLLNQKREEKWRKEDTERLRYRIEFRKKHPVSTKLDRRWIALSKGV